MIAICPKYDQEQLSLSKMLDIQDNKQKMGAQAFHRDHNMSQKIRIIADVTILSLFKEFKTSNFLITIVQCAA